MEFKKRVALQFRRICSSEQDCLKKSKEYMAYVVLRGQSPKKVERTFENIGKMTRTEGRVNKQKVISKNTIIFPAVYNPRGPMSMLLLRDMNIFYNIRLS